MRKIDLRHIEPLLPTGGAATVTAAAALTGTGTQSVAGVRTRLGTAALTGTGTSSTTGVRTRLAAAALTGAGSLTAAGAVTITGAAALVGNGTITSDGTRVRFGAAALTGTGSLTVGGVVGIAGAATLTGASSGTVAGLLVVDHRGTSSGSSATVVGAGGSNEALAQKFIAPHDSSLLFAEFVLAKRGSPVDDVRFDLFSDSGGAPGALISSSAVVAAASLPSTIIGATPTRLAFTNPNIVGGQTYWVILTRTGTRDTTNFYEAEIRGDPPADSLSIETSGVWAGASAELRFLVAYDLAIVEVTPPTGGGYPYPRPHHPPARRVERQPVIHYATVALHGRGTLNATGTVTRTGSAQLVGLGYQTVAGTRTQYGSAALYGTTTLAATGSLVFHGAATLRGTGALTVSGDWSLGARGIEEELVALLSIDRTLTAR